MSIEVAVQLAYEGPSVPMESTFQHWVEAALVVPKEALEVVIRVVDEAEGAQLNRRYRDASGPTNVLSFPFAAPPGVAPEEPGLPLGDLVICAPVVAREAHAQHKVLNAHWAHLVVHGLLHLQGFDHQNPVEAERMEALEVEILAGLGLSDPYKTMDCDHG